MTLPETFEVIRPSIVALGSGLAQTTSGELPAFPRIVGTGIIVDSRGVVVTNRHVVEELRQLPPNPKTGAPSDFALLFTGPETTLSVEIRGYAVPESFHYAGEDFYGETMPDLAFLQLKVSHAPFLNLAIAPNTLRVGMSIATAGFPPGTDPFMESGKIPQTIPLLRQGIVSSLYPLPGPHPHGFAIDTMMQDGGNGSPIWLTESPTVIGMLYACLQDANITLALPSEMINAALASCLASTPQDSADDAPAFQGIFGEGS